MVLALESFTPANPTRDDPNVPSLVATAHVEIVQQSRRDGRGLVVYAAVGTVVARPLRTNYFERHSILETVGEFAFAYPEANYHRCF